MRAFDPFPGATFQAHGETVKLWRAQVERLDVAAAPGTVIAVDGQQLVVACGDGALALLDVQRPGGKRGPVAQWLQGQPLARGDRARLSAARNWAADRASSSGVRGAQARARGGR